MTPTLVESSVAEQHPRATASAHSRRGIWTRRRVELRLATRQVRRAWPTSLLVMALVALPMIAVTGGATFLASRTPTIQQTLTANLGQTNAWFMVVGGEDPSRSQSPAEPYDWTVFWNQDGTPVNPELPPREDVKDLLPDVDLLRVTSTRLLATTPGGSGAISAFVGDIGDPRLDGRFDLLDGRRPMKASEAALSPGAAERLDVELGGTIELRDPAMMLTVVGVMKDSSLADREQTLFIPGATDIEAGESDTLWYAADWQPSVDDLPALNQAGIVAYARDIVQAAGGSNYQDPATAWTIAASSAIVATFLAYLIVLLAGAGFGVSARRQQRALAMAASVGADRASVFRIVLLQGSVLGLTGGTVGAAIGVALAYPALALFDDGAASSFWGFHVPWWAIVGIVLFATTVGTASAVVPARAATRGDVLASLRGTRRPAALKTERPFWGLLLFACGVAATVVSALGLTALNDAETVDYNNPLRTLCIIGIVAGPLLFQIGTVLAGHWLLTLVASGARRAGLALRIASRDAAANPSRIVPAFAAIAACVFIASFALTAVGVFSAQTTRTWWYQAPLGSVIMSVYPSDGDESIVQRARDVLEESGPRSIGIVEDDADSFLDPSDPENTIQNPVYAEQFDYVDCSAAAAGPCASSAEARLTYAPVVVNAADLTTVLGVALDDSVIDAYRDGGALILDSARNGLSGTLVSDGVATLNSFDSAEVQQYWSEYSGTASLPKPRATREIPATRIELEHSLPWSILISPAVADDIGYRTTPQLLIASYATPPSQETLDRMTMQEDQSITGGGFSHALEQGPPDPAAWLWLILAAATVLVLGAGSVALGLARVERRPDDATLAAVGASPGLRRRIAFWQALLIVGIGSATGTVAGIIPMWGIVMTTADDGFWGLKISDTPWPLLALLALGLPFAIALASWLVPTGRPDLTRRTVIA